MEIVPLLQHAGNSRHLLLHALTRIHLVLKPVALLLITQCRYQVIIICEVVKAIERRDILKSLYQHSLLSQCVVIQRAMHLIHTVFPGPILGSPDKKSCDLDVIDGIEPAEAGSFLAIQLIITRIDHGADTPDHFAAVKHHP